MRGMNFRSNSDSSLGTSSSTISLNHQRPGRAISTKKGVEHFNFDTPFSNSDGTTPRDIIITTTRIGSNINVPLGIKDVTLDGFSIDRRNVIKGDAPFFYHAVNSNASH